MLKNKSFRRLICVALSMLLVMTSLVYADGPNLGAVQYADIAGSKYESQLREWIDNGFIKGNPDGSFRPNATVTRAEFMALVNRSFGFTETAEINYADVLKDKWFYGDIAKATKAGYMKGYNGSIMPLDPISRQEFAVVLARLTHNDAAADDKVISGLSDGKLIPEWSRAAVSTAVGNGFFEGFVDKSFKPVEKVTRLEVVVALDRAFKSMYKAVYSKKGTYGPAGGMNILDGSAAIVSPDVTLMNTTINGDLILRESIGDGNVYLENVVVKGTTIVKGGGEHSIVIKNSSLGKVIVRKEGNTVRIVVTGSTTIGQVDVQSGARLEEEFLTGSGFGDIVIPDDILAGANIVFEGAFDNIQVDSSNVNINVESGTIGNLTLTQQAAGTTVNLTQQASVGTLNLSAAVNITGQGTIQTANINAQGATIQQQPQNVVAAPGITVTISNPAPTPAPTTQSSGGGGGGSNGGGGNDDDDDDDFIYVTGVSLDKATMTLTAGGASGTLSATVSPSNATNKKVTWSSSNTSVATVANGTVTPLAAGTAIITVTTEDRHKTAACEVTVEEPAVVVNKDALAATISIAEEKADAAIVGDEAGNYPQSAVDALRDAINAAQEVMDDADATQEEVDETVEDLNEAVISFEESVVKAPDTYIVTVFSNPVDGGEVTVTEKVYFEEGDEVTVTATPNTGYEFINWTDNDESEVSTENHYTFNMPANNVILTANFKEIGVHVNHIEINQQDQALVVGDTVQLSATIEPSNATNQAVHWESDDTDVATVDNNGLVTAVAIGTANITVTSDDGGYTDSIKIEAVGATIEYATTEDIDFDIVIAFGTSEEDAKTRLAQTVGVIGSKGENGTAAIEWTIANYNGNEAGDYQATGELTLPNGWTGDPADVIATVTIEEEPVTYSVTFVVSPEGSIIAVRDSKGVEVTAEENGIYKLEAGEYSYTIIKDGYITKIGDLTVTNNDETITITLEEEITDEDREAAKATLADKVAAKIEYLEDIDEVDVSFNKVTKTTTITILDEGATIADLSGTGAMVALAEMEEVRGYTIGETTKNFYDSEGNREDYATIKGWIITDALEALKLSNDISLSALIDKYLSVEVIGLAGRVDFTDEYTFEFVKDLNQAAANAVTAKINALPTEVALEDKAAVEEAREAYEALTDAQEALVGADVLAKLTAAEAKITELEAAKAIEDAKAAFNTAAELVTEIKAGDEKLAEINFDASANSAVVTLTNADKTILEVAGTGIFSTILPSLGVKAVKFGSGEYMSLELPGLDVTALANAIFEEMGAPTPQTLADLDGRSISYTAKIQPAGHVEFEQEFTVTFRLSDGEKDRLAANAVTAKINALPTGVALEDKAAVEEARAAYQALTDAQEALVGADVLAKLTAAEAKITELEAEAAKVAAATEAVVDYEAAAITTLEEVAAAEVFEVIANGKVSQLALGDTKTGLEARISAKKALVNAAKADLVAAEEADSFRTAHAEILGKTVETISITDKEAVDIALAGYEGLSDAVKAKLTTEKTLLDNLLLKIAELELAGAKAVANTKVEVEYTIASWTVLENALALPEDTKVQMVDKTDAINLAIQGLIRRADLTAYNAALVLVSGESYTEESWAAYQLVVEANAVTAENSQSEVDAATKAITDAQRALERRFPIGITNDSRITDFVNDSTYPWKHDGSITDKVSFYPTNQGVDNSTSSITCVVTGNGLLTYDYKVSAEDEWDYLKVYVDNILVKEHKSSTDWTSDYVTMSNETQIVKFEYEKDGSFNSNDDKVWIANLRLANGLNNFILDYDIDEGTVVGKVNGVDEEFVVGDMGNAISIGSSIELTASPIEGYTFVGWKAGSNKIVSYNTAYTFTLLEDITVTPLFYYNNESHVARIGATGYETLEAALNSALLDDVVILLNNYTMTADATVPEGVLLLLPYSSNDYVGYTNTGYNPNGTSTSTNNLEILYKTLTIPQEVTLTIDGTVMVNAVTGRPAAGTYLHDITGGYSQIILNGDIKVNNDGLIDVFGKVTGTGLIEAFDGGSVGDLYVVKNWRGGSQALFGCYSHDIFPFNEYDLHNIEVVTKINSGASYYGNVKMYASGKYYYTRFYQFDQAKGLMRLTSGAHATKEYDRVSKHTTITINGGAEEIGGAMNIAGTNVSTSDFIFPIDGHITLVLENGDYAIDNSIKLLPGSALTISDDANIRIKPDAQLIIYEEFIDADNTGNTEYPLRAPAELNLNGSLIIEGSFGGLINADSITAKVVVGSNATLEVSSGETHGYYNYPGFTIDYYTVTTNLGIRTIPGQETVWYYYPSTGSVADAVLVDAAYASGMDYFNLNSDASSYKGHTFIVHEYVLSD